VLAVQIAILGLRSSEQQWLQSPGPYRQWISGHRGWPEWTYRAQG
jgi:hypothetical protein